MYTQHRLLHLAETTTKLHFDWHQQATTSGKCIWTKRRLKIQHYEPTYSGCRKGRFPDSRLNINSFSIQTTKLLLLLQQANYQGTPHVREHRRLPSSRQSDRRSENILPNSETPNLPKVEKKLETVMNPIVDATVIIGDDGGYHRSKPTKTRPSSKEVSWFLFNILMCARLSKQSVDCLCFLLLVSWLIVTKWSSD